MDAVVFLLVISALPQFVAPRVPDGTSLRASIEMATQDSRIFSGESLRLRCSIPGGHRSTWNYLWFRGSDQLPQTGEEFSLWNANVRDSGKFSCQGVRDSLVGDIHTLRSLPVEINIDGGWAILHVSPDPGLVGDTLRVTCRVRDNRPVHERILYRDGVEVMRQNGLDPHFYLTNLTLQDQGMYSCRASWNYKRRTHSVISAATHVVIQEVLSQPVLEIDTGSDLIPASKMKLVCHLQYNAPAPAPQIHYYFYKNGNRLGTATSENHDLVKRTPGVYSCKAKVPQLGISKWSEPKGFGQMTGPQPMMPPRLVPTYHRPLVPPVSSPDRFPPPAAQPGAAQRSTATPTVVQRTEETSPSTYPPLKPSQQVPSILLTTVQFFNPTTTPDHAPPPAAQPTTVQLSTYQLNSTRTSIQQVRTSQSPLTPPHPGQSTMLPAVRSSPIPAPGLVHRPQEPADMSGESGDMSGESGDMSGESGDMSGQSDDMP